MRYRGSLSFGVGRRLSRSESGTSGQGGRAGPIAGTAILRAVGVWRRASRPAAAGKLRYRTYDARLKLNYRNAHRYDLAVCDGEGSEGEGAVSAARAVQWAALVRVLAYVRARRSALRSTGLTQQPE